MGLFSGKGNGRDRDMGEEIERAKREGSQLERVAYAHQQYDRQRPAPTKNSRSAASSGPRCDSANDRQRGRRW
ncbi:hypothetical protein [Streptomyces sp. NPDC005407]|uniref:hypothetical protein n=1 Tax=Streptomyces sp. NPDC005407 TaxID=3155340 RepID=UPI00339F0EFF